MSAGARTVRFDADREGRIGLAEAVLADTKPPGPLAEAVDRALAAGGRALVTRLSPEAFAALPRRQRAALDYDPVSRTALAPPAGALAEPAVAILTGGTGDLPVAREAARTLAFHGRASVEVLDVGVAGLWRVLEHRDLLSAAPAVIVCAGMEGALFSVVAGLARGLAVAVPVSNGYGVAAGGRAALDAALASCAPGLAVVNIDNGYGAACVALRALGAARTGSGAP